MCVAVIYLGMPSACMHVWFFLSMSHMDISDWLIFWEAAMGHFPIVGYWALYRMQAPGCRKQGDWEGPADMGHDATLMGGAGLCEGWLDSVWR